MKMAIFGLIVLFGNLLMADEELKLKTQSISDAANVEIACGEENVVKIKSLMSLVLPVQVYTFEVKDSCVQMKALLKLVDQDCPLVLNTTPSNSVDSSELSCDIDQQKSKKETF